MTPIELRKLLRQRRNALSPNEQQANASQALNHFRIFIDSYFQESAKIALFLSQDGELDTQQSIDFLWHETDHQVYLPVLETKDGLHMGFAEYTPDSRMQKNQFGIDEPDVAIADHLTGAELDLVLMPLVGFDNEGNRLGMGGGYYDRSFAFKLENPNAKPLLIGWAHACQQVATLPREKWDVPLNGMITEKNLTQW